MQPSPLSCRHVSGLLTGLLTALSLTFSNPASASVEEIFLRLSGIQGGSIDDRHRNELELLSYSLSVQNSANFGFGAAAAGKATSCGEIVVQKRIDPASAALVMRVLTGAHIPDGLITFRRPGKEQQVYYTVQLTDIIVSSVEQTYVTGTTTGVMEVVKIKARQFRFNYFPQKPDGSLGSVQSFGFDCASNSRL